jgi:hypothetical protein
LKFCSKNTRRANIALLLTLSSFSVTLAFAQTPSAQPASSPADSSQPASSEPSSLPGYDESVNERIFGIIPSYLTVENPQQAIVPLTVEQKFELFAKETFDPYTFASSAAGAAISQINNDNPKYGRGGGAYAQRLGAAVTDVTTQNFFQDAVLASWLHEDPRYFRRGPEFGVWHRVGYALSRVVITRTDKGTERFNYSGILGMSMGIALSNAYYPDPSVNGEEVASRFGTSLLASALGNLLQEFWPDFQEKVLHHRRPHPPRPNGSAPASTP